MYLLSPITCYINDLEMKFLVTIGRPDQDGWCMNKGTCGLSVDWTAVSSAPLAIDDNGILV